MSVWKMPLPKKLLVWVVGRNNRLKLSIISHHHCGYEEPVKATNSSLSGVFLRAHIETEAAEQSSRSQVHYLIQAVLCDLNGIVMGAEGF